MLHIHHFFINLIKTFFCFIKLFLPFPFLHLFLFFIHFHLQQMSVIATTTQRIVSFIYFFQMTFFSSLTDCYITVKWQMSVQLIQAHQFFILMKNNFQLSFQKLCGFLFLHCSSLVSLEMMMKEEMEMNRGWNL